MEIETLEVIPFDQIGKEPEPKKEEKTEEKEPKTEVTSDEGLISFDDLMQPNTEEQPSTEKKEAKAPVENNVLATTLKALYEKEGLEFNEEEFDGTIESYLTLQEDLSDRKAQVKLDSHIQNNLNPLNKKFIELVDNGVSVEDAADLMKSLKTISQINKDDISSDLELAEKIQKEYLRNTTNFSPEKIEKEIKKSKEAGVLMAEAESNYDELVEVVSNYEAQLKQEVVKNTQAQQAKAQKQLQDLQDFIDSTEEIGGIKLSKKLKESWTKEYQTVEANGQKVNPIFATRQKDEAKFDALLRFYHTIGLFKYDTRKKDFIPDLSVLKNVGKADVIKELEAAISNNNQKGINRSLATSSTDTMEQVINDGYKKLEEAIKNKKIK
jgi:hypothetical protein